ncbi:MAG: DUF4910 domain-containing protein [Candidatus Methanofastidiosia archaeon]|jgi:hypothetical protein
MFKHIFKTVEKEISGKNAKNLAVGVTQFHRIQVSPHFRKAAKWCNRQLENYGLKTEIHEYTADGETVYWTSLLPREWKVESATLTINGDTWANFRDTQVSLIQRSHPFNGEAEIVHIETDTEEDFTNIEGKIVHSPLPLEKIIDYALHYKAAGIITSGIREITMRTRMDVPEAVHYYSFWGEKGSGFVISPKQGEKLKKLIKKKQTDGDTLTGKMVIDSVLYPGTMEVVDAFIPGETCEEVLVVAHLCHPQPSANDNASGDGALMEVARTLHKLITEKKLKKPKRGIRFLLVPEMHGTVAYLASNEQKIPDFVAGINLDMVGENQDVCKSPLLFERTPDCMPSFVNDLGEIIFEELTQEIGNFAGTKKYASFKHAVTPFSGGSDHYVLSDPTVGIPCPMVIHWPDMFYHSSLDTPEKMDAKELERVSKLTATYAYFIAAAGRTEAQWLASVMCEKTKERISKKVRDILTEESEDFENAEREKEKGKEKENKNKNKKEKEKVDYHGLLDYLLYRDINALHSLKRLASIDVTSLENELKEFVAAEKKKIPSRKSKKEECSWIPKRIYRGPISIRKTLLEMPYEERKIYQEKQEEYEGARVMGTMAVYWSDGERTLSEINELLKYEIGRSSLDYLKWYFQFLRDHGLIGLKK